MTHRAAEIPGGPKQRRNPFSTTALPHWAMGLVTLFWLYFQVTLGTAGVPGPVNQAFAAIFALWTSYLFNAANLKGNK